MSQHHLIRRKLLSQLRQVYELQTRYSTAEGTWLTSLVDEARRRFNFRGSIGDAQELLEESGEFAISCDGIVDGWSLVKQLDGAPLARAA